MHILYIKGQKFDYDIASDVRNGAVQALLSSCYQVSNQRPKCFCTGKPLDLQVKRRNGIFHLARMPHEGKLHADDCPHNGETNHRISNDSSRNLSLNFTVHLKQNDSPKGEITLAGLLNNIWMKAGLNKWNRKDQQRGWTYVARKIYAATQGLKVNGIPLTRLIWVMPNMDASQVNLVRENCLSFVKSANQNNHQAIIIAPIGYSEYQNHSMCIRFRTIDKPPIFIDYKKFPIKTYALKDKGDYPFPVAIMLVRCPNEKPYLQASDIAMLWMSSNYLPALTKSRCANINEVMHKCDEIESILDPVFGKYLTEVAHVRYGDRLVSIDSSEPDPKLPWIINE